MTIDELTYFGLGAAVGAIAGILLAPGSGGETRTFLASEVEKGTDYVTSRVTQASDAASQTVRRAEKAVRQHTENVVAAADAGVAAYREAVQTTP